MPRRKNNWRCIVGLTGGMGSGKSTVLAMFKKKGAFTQDADAIVKDLLEKDRKVHAEIKSKFGAGVFDAGGRVDKKAVARRIFGKPRERKVLERILHPRVRAAIWGALAKKKGKVAVLDIPLLYESKWQNKLDGVIVVNAGMQTRLARLRKRGVPEAEARRRIKAQMSLAEKVRRADFIVDNDGHINKTKKQINEIWKQLPNIRHGGN